MVSSDIGFLLKNDNFTTIFLKEEIKIDAKELVDNVYAAIKEDIIAQFGLSQFYEDGMFKEGGHISTVHNARKGVIANEEDELRFNRPYNRNDYDRRYKIETDPITKKKTVTNVDCFNKIRKNHFQKKDIVIDIYTGKELPIDGRAQLDHIKSAKEIHDDDWMRLHATKEEIANVATNEDNLGFTHSSINQSKSSQNVEEWMVKTQKGQSFSNKNRYEINEELTKKENSKARNSFNKKKIKIVTKDYTQKVSTEGMKRGTALAKKQILGILIAETSDLIFKAILPVIYKWNSFESMKERISEISKRIQTSFENAKEKLINLLKRLIQGVSSAFASGMVSVLFETFFNSFTTTTAKFGKLLKDSVSSIIQAFQVIFSRDSSISKSEKLREGIKIVGSALITSLSLIISQSITETIKANPSSPLIIFAEEIGIGIGVLLTGFLVPTFIFTLENFGEITKEIRNTFALMNYGITVKAEDIEKEFQNIKVKVDDIYQEIMEDIYLKYKNFNKLHDMIDDFTDLANEQFGYSVAYAQAWGVSDNSILKNKTDIDDYFMG